MMNTKGRGRKPKPGDEELLAKVADLVVGAGMKAKTAMRQILAQEHGEHSTEAGERRLSRKWRTAGPALVEERTRPLPAAPAVPARSPSYSPAPMSAMQYAQAELRKVLAVQEEFARFTRANAAVSQSLRIQQQLSEAIAFQDRVNQAMAADTFTRQYEIARLQMEAAMPGWMNYRPTAVEEAMASATRSLRVIEEAQAMARLYDAANVRRW